MSKISFIGLSAALVITGSLPIVTLAESVLAQTTHEQEIAERLVVLPVSTAIIARADSALQLELSELSQTQGQSISLSLDQPIFDNIGKVAAPAGSIVMGQLVGVEQGVQIFLESLVISGRVVPVQAASHVISSEIIEQQVEAGRPSAGEIALGILGLHRSNGPDTEEVEVVNISTNTPYVFSLEQVVSVSLPSQIETQSASNSDSGGSSSTSSVNFNLATESDTSSGSLDSTWWDYPQENNTVWDSIFGSGSESQSSAVCAEYDREYEVYQSQRDYWYQTEAYLRAQGVDPGPRPVMPERPSGC